MIHTMTVANRDLREKSWEVAIRPRVASAIGSSPHFPPSRSPSSGRRMWSHLHKSMDTGGTGATAANVTLERAVHASRLRPHSFAMTSNKEANGLLMSVRNAGRPV